MNAYVAKYTQPIELEDLPYTPSEYGGMLEQHNKTKKQVIQKINIDGLGEGRLAITKANKPSEGYKTLFYPDEKNQAFNEQQAKKAERLFFFANAPAIFAPVLAPFTAKSQPVVRIRADGSKHKITKGGQNIFQQKKSNKKTLERLKNEQRVEDVTGFGDKPIAEDVFNMPTSRVQQIVKIAKRNNISYQKAEQYVNLKEQGITPTETINPGTNAGLLGKGASLNELSARFMQQGKNRGMIYDKDGNPIQPKNYYGPVEETGPNYSAIEGPDFDSGNFNWLSARTGKPYHFDISGHRIFEVPGMQNEKEATRYKNWLTNSLVQRFKDQTVVPDKQITFFHSNKDFIDSKGNPWQLVRANKRAKGPNQTYIPTPKNEVDSRKMKKQNTNNEEKVLLRALMAQNVSQRNATEKKISLASRMDFRRNWSKLS